MAQKTNPLSLRLHKKVKTFSSSWYSDFFYSQMITRENLIRSYQHSLFASTRHSIAFLSLTCYYRKTKILAVIHDTRGIRREKASELFLSPLQTEFPLLSGTCSEKPLIPKATHQYSEKIQFDNFIVKLWRNFVKSSSVKRNPSNFGKVIDFTCKNSVKAFDSNFAFFNSSRKQNRKQTQTLFPLTTKLSYTTKLWLQTPFAKSLQKQKLLEASDKKDFDFKSRNFEIEPYRKKDSQQLKTRFKKQIENNIDAYFSKKYTLPRSFQVLMNTENDFLETREKIRFSRLDNRFETVRLISEMQNVDLLIDNLKILIEKRASFRELKQRIFREIESNREILGIRIAFSGRLGGRSKKAQKAKLDKDYLGSCSLNTFSSRISFAKRSAFTPSGKVGIKVWLSFR